MKIASLGLLAGTLVLWLASCGHWQIGGGTDKPGAPAWVNAAAVSNSAIDVSWAPADGSWSGYNLYRNGSLYSSNLAVNAIADSGLANNTNYCYSVSTLNGVHESALAGPACANTLP